MKKRDHLKLVVSNDKPTTKKKYKDDYAVFSLRKKVKDPERQRRLNKIADDLEAYLKRKDDKKK